MKRRFIITAFILPFLFMPTHAQTVSVADDPESLREMLAKQPDYTATQQFLFSEGFGGFGVASKIAKLGSREAEIREDTVFINEPGKSTIKVFPKRKEYAEMPVEKNDDFAVSTEELAKRNDVIFKSPGTEKVGKYTCIKIEITYKDEKLNDMKFLFWVAPELKNLVIRSEISLGPQVKFSTLLEDISFEVDASIFQIPAGYKKVVEPDNMKDLEKKIRKTLRPSTRRRTSHSTGAPIARLLSGNLDA